MTEYVFPACSRCNRRRLANTAESAHANAIVDGWEIVESLEDFLRTGDPLAGRQLDPRDETWICPECLTDEELATVARMVEAIDRLADEAE